MHKLLAHDITPARVQKAPSREATVNSPQQLELSFYQEPSVQDISLAVAACF